MQHYESLVRKIMNEYDEARTYAHHSLEERINKVHTDFPKLKEIEDEINRLGIENFGKIIKNPDRAKEFNEEFDLNVKNLKNKKAELLKEYCVDADYDQIKYTCEKCFDTGYCDTEKCSCFVQKLINVRYDLSNMKDILHDFSEFSFDYYSDEIVEGLGITEKENIKEIYNKAVDFCENDKAKNLFFYGGCGFGKTFLSSCIAKKMMDNGKTVIYTSASGLFSAYEDYKFGKKENDDFPVMREIMRDSDLLIIDDLGCEVISALSCQLLNEILNERVMMKKKIIISTNMNMKGITSKYTDRVASRIYEAFDILHFAGRDIRIQKLIKD